MGKYYTEEEVSNLETELMASGKPEEDINSVMELIKEKDLPDYWGNKYFFDPDTGETEFISKKIFEGFLRCGNKKKSGRVGRQVGKTVHTVLDLLHTAYFEKNSIILIFVPQKMLMNRMLDIMSNMIRKSSIRHYFSQSKSSGKSKGIESKYDCEIKVGPPGEVYSNIRFFFTGQNPDKARGQRATHIYIDEADYHPDKAWPVITGIIKGNTKIKITAISTPKGVTTSWYYNFCSMCRKLGTEFHITPDMDPNWEEIEKELRAVIFDEITWKLEVLAEFVEPLGAVYKKELIDNAISRSMIGKKYMTAQELFNTGEYEDGKKVLGIDWNTPQNGVRVVEIVEMFEKSWVIRNDIISYKDFTQTKAVEYILKLYDENKYNKICVDAGYGNTQIELLNLGLTERKVNSNDVIHIVDSVKKEKTIIKYFDPELNVERRRVIDVSVKHKIVDLVSKYLELNLVFLEEMSKSNKQIVSEVRGFIRKQGSNSYVYSDQSHSLSALQIGLHGWDLLVNSEKLSPGSTMVINNPDIYNSIIESRKDGNYGMFSKRSLRTNKRTSGLNGQKRRSIL